LGRAENAGGTELDGEAELRCEALPLMVSVLADDTFVSPLMSAFAGAVQPKIEAPTMAAPAIRPNVPVLNQE
jgi:hypothetical protein